MERLILIYLQENKYWYLQIHVCEEANIQTYAYLQKWQQRLEEWKFKTEFGTSIIKITMLEDRITLP